MISNSTVDGKRVEGREFERAERARGRLGKDQTRSLRKRFLPSLHVRLALSDQSLVLCKAFLNEGIGLGLSIPPWNDRVNGELNARGVLVRR